MSFLKKMLSGIEEKAKTVLDGASAAIEGKIDEVDAKVQERVEDTSRTGTISNMKTTGTDVLNSLGEVQLTESVQNESEVPVVDVPTISEDDLDDLL